MGSVIDPRQVAIQAGSPSQLNLDPSGNLYHNQAAVTSNGGDYVSETAVPFAANTATVIYTCPSTPATRVYLLTVNVSMVGSDVTTLGVYRTGSNLYYDLIWASKSGSVLAGQGPANTVVIPSGFVLLPGDELVLVDGTSGGTGGTATVLGLGIPL